MNILQLATVDNGGATWFYRAALREHVPGVSCRAVRWSRHGLDYPADVQSPDREELGRLYRWADVVHLHDEAGWLIRKWKPKPAVVTYHGSRYRRAPDQYAARCERAGWLLTVSTYDLTAWGGRWLPTPRRDVSGDWNPAARFVVCHAPPNRNRKRTELVLDAVRQAGGCRLQLVEGQAYRRAMQKKARASCLVDGWLGYGNNSIEAWAFGMPTVSGVPADVRDRMLAAWGRLPFVETRADAGALAAVLARLRRDPVFYTNAQEAGREHYEAYHRPDRVAAMLYELYEEALG